MPGPGPWSGTRVVELSSLPSAYGTRMWAALGADVIKVEPPGGDPLRSIPPTVDGVDPAEAGLWWAYLAAGKRSVVVDSTTDDGRARLDALVASADVVVDDAPAATHDAWRRRSLAEHETLVWVAITPFGLTGPHRDWLGSDLVAWSSCGLAYTIGFPDRPPLAPAAQVQLAMHVASLNATIAAMFALRSRRRTGRGQLVDLSIQECCLATAPETGVPLFLDDRVARPRDGNRRPVTSPLGLYPSADGYVSILALQPNHWGAFAHWISEETGNEGILDEIWIDIAVRREAAEAVDLWIEELTTKHSKLDLFIEGQRRGIPITPVNTVADLIDDPHLEAVGWWRDEEHPDLGSYTVPGSPFRTRHDWWAWARAPRLGEHTGEVLAEIDDERG